MECDLKMMLIRGMYFVRQFLLVLPRMFTKTWKRSKSWNKYLPIHLWVRKTPWCFAILWECVILNLPQKPPLSPHRWVLDGEGKSLLLGRFYFSYFLYIFLKLKQGMGCQFWWMSILSLILNRRKLWEGGVRSSLNFLCRNCGYLLYTHETKGDIQLGKQSRIERKASKLIRSSLDTFRTTSQSLIHSEKNKLEKLKFKIFCVILDHLLNIFKRIL